ncbi:MAG: mitochondrial fission ELM1 family protein [Proteobacteria bacterium]|nr:mitochondrial fission ELM1 family protein [Pseudomonadota bacterium]
MKEKTCWTITDEFPGMKSQVIGLAEAVGLPTLHKTCIRRWPWGWLGIPWGDPLTQLTPESDSLTPPWPDLVISCGRRSAPLALAIKEKSKKKMVCVHIQDPLVNHGAFDLIAAPEHDNLKGPNVISTKGALHKVTREKMHEDVQKYKSLFKGLPRPYSVVLLGGSTNRYKMPLAALEDLIQKILFIRDKTQGSVLVTPSFRTPFRAQLTQALANESNIFLADIEKQNPYFAMLGVADVIFATDDSVNMVCEACFTGKPVYSLPLMGHRNSKPKRFIQRLIQEGIVRSFEGEIDTWTYVPFNDTEKVAALVRETLKGNINGPKN